MPARWLVAISLLATLFLSLAGMRSLSPAGLPPAVQPYAYDLIRWEMESLVAKGLFVLEGLISSPDLLPDRSDAVRRYFALAQRLNSHEASARGVRLELQDRAGEESGRLPEEMMAMASDGEELRELVEATIEEQIGSILAEQGLALSLPGYDEAFPIPPVRFTLERPPHLLITSPRGEIKLLRTWLLSPDLSPEEMAAIEEQVESAEVSALVEPLGGLATYPSIVRPGGSLKDALIAVAHEWTHAYLLFHPLGRRYGANYEMTILNEMVATMAGKEVGDLAYRRYYAQEAEASRVTGKKLSFDFNREMRKIRKAVDEYLKRGEISAAEAFMAERRQFLASQGYHIRKLNQAYFAFHSAYADSPSAVSPIEGYLKDLRKRSGSLAAFLHTVAQIKSYADLPESATQRAQPALAY